MGTRKPVNLSLIFISIFSSIVIQPCFSWTGSEPEILKPEIELFHRWRETHGKTYDHGDETAKRFENFRRNVGFIVESGSDRSGFSVGLNKFADLSNDEFREMYFGRSRRSVRFSEPVGSTGFCDVPLYVDWREKGVVTQVKDQGVFGSSWAYSSIGAIEGINAINVGELISLSEQALIDCDETNYNGCDGGEKEYAFEKLEESESALLCATVNQPISVGVHGSSLDFQLYTGGIYDGACSGNPEDIDHSVLIVGYGSEGDNDYWIVKNSWGANWGMNGYMYIRRNTNLPYGVCAINARALYPTQKNSATSPSSTPPAPSPTSPPPPQPTPPFSHLCGDYSYCGRGQTCCCLYEFSGFCLIPGCCDYVDGVCCPGTDYCCPREYPVCDPDESICLQNSGDYVGVSARKKSLAKLKLPWEKLKEQEEKASGALQWRKAAMR